MWGRYFNRTSKPQLGFTANDEWVDAPDYGAYFGDGLVHYAGSNAGRRPPILEAQIWVHELVASQDPDGYIGAFQPSARWQNGLEIFHQSLLIDALLFAYELNREPAVLEACERASNRIMQAWYGPDKLLEPDIFSSHGTIIVRTMGRMYATTGDIRYRDFGKEILARYGMTKPFLSGGNHVVYEHNVVVFQNTTWGCQLLVYE